MSVVRRLCTSGLVRWSAVTATYLAVVGVAGAVVASAIDRLAATWLAEPASQITTVAPSPATPAAATAAATPAMAEPTPFTIIRRSTMVPTTDDWAEKLRDPAFWAKLKSGNSGTRKSVSAPASWALGGPQANDDEPRLPAVTSDDAGGEETYRTVCVRLCDGAFFPISFSTTRDQFDADAAKCEKTCTGGRLYYHRNPGGDLDDMEDREGLPYNRLPTAFLYRTTFNEQCKCRPHPWEEAARDRHRVYALETQRNAGDRTAVAELSNLTTKIMQADAEASAAVKRADASVQRRLTETLKADVKETIASTRRQRTSAKHKTTIKANATQLAADTPTTGLSGNRKRQRR